MAHRLGSNRGDRLPRVRRRLRGARVATTVRIALRGVLPCGLPLAAATPQLLTPVRCRLGRCATGRRSATPSTEPRSTRYDSTRLARSLDLHLWGWVITQAGVHHPVSPLATHESSAAQHALADEKSEKGRVGEEWRS